MIHIPHGTYRHYKGNLYEIIAVGKDEATLKDVVVYRALYDTTDLGPRPVFVRPLENFMGMVEIDGKQLPRFTKIS